jgi:hypothetical protein
MNGVQSTTFAEQPPWPSQFPAALRVFPVQLAAGPQVIELSGKVQAPVESSQSTAPQGVAVLAQPEVQQWPVPMTPQMPELQASFSAHDPRGICGTQAPELQ